MRPVFRMLNRRPLDLPALDTLVPFVEIQLENFTSEQVRHHLRQMPNLLFNANSGWYFALSSKGIAKMPAINFPDIKEISTTIHLVAVANLDRLIRHATLGYSKPEPPNRINSFGKTVKQNADLKANHRFYAGAWIDGKPYSVRMLIREYFDGTVELGEEAQTYALNIKEMRGFAPGDSSVPPASHGLTTALSYNPLIQGSVSGNISASSSRCEPTPPTETAPIRTKIVQTEQETKYPPYISLQSLIEANLKTGEETLYREREKFDYTLTGTNRLETLFDRLRLTGEQRDRLYRGEAVEVHNLRLRQDKLDVLIMLHNGELQLRPIL